MSTRKPGGGLQREVLAVLAAADESLTSAQVLAALGRPLAYMTVMTTLTRLHSKGAVTNERAGRAYTYRWCDQPTVTARQMRRLLDGDEDRAQVLAKFVSELAPEDGQLLEAMLQPFLAMVVLSPHVLSQPVWHLALRRAFWRARAWSRPWLPGSF